MSTLKEDLSELSSALPPVPGEVAGLKQHAQELADAASAVLQQVDHERQEVSVLLTQARDTLGSFTVEVDALEKRLETSVGSVEKAWADGHSQLGVGEHSFANAFEQVNAARTDLIRGLFEAGTKVDRASADGEAAIGRLEATARDGHDRTQAAAGPVSKEVATLHALVERTKTSLSEANQAFLAKAAHLMQTVEHDVEALLADVQERVKGHQEHLASVRASLATGLDGIVKSAETRLHDGLTGALGTAGQKLRIAMESLADGTNVQEAAVGQARGDFNDALTQLQATAAHLPDGIRDIHAAMARIVQ